MLKHLLLLKLGGIYMMNENPIFWLSVVVLVGIFLYCCYTLLRAYRKERVPIAYAGIIHGNKPSDSKINARSIALLMDQLQLTADRKKALKAFVIEGNSMQYADIKSGDIVFASDDAITEEILPKVVVLRNSNDSKADKGFKLRRAWGICDSATNPDHFIAEIKAILRSDKFKELRLRLGHFCPSDEKLLDEALLKFQVKKVAGEGKLLISTTYKSDEGKVVFSIHRMTDVIGVVSAVASKKYV